LKELFTDARGAKGAYSMSPLESVAEGLLAPNDELFVKPLRSSLRSPEIGSYDTTFQKQHLENKICY